MLARSNAGLEEVTDSSSSTHRLFKKAILFVRRS